MRYPRGMRKKELGKNRKEADARLAVSTFAAALCLPFLHSMPPEFSYAEGKNRESAGSLPLCVYKSVMSPLSYSDGDRCVCYQEW